MTRTPVLSQSGSNSSSSRGSSSVFATTYGAGRESTLTEDGGEAEDERGREWEAITRERASLSAMSGKDEGYGMDDLGMGLGLGLDITQGLSVRGLEALKRYADDDEVLPTARGLSLTGTSSLEYDDLEEEEEDEGDKTQVYDRSVQKQLSSYSISPGRSSASQPPLRSPTGPTFSTPPMPSSSTATTPPSSSQPRNWRRTNSASMTDTTGESDSNVSPDESGMEDYTTDDDEGMGRMSLGGAGDHSRHFLPFGTGSSELRRVSDEGVLFPAIGRRQKGAGKAWGGESEADREVLELVEGSGAKGVLDRSGTSCEALFVGTGELVYERRWISY